jgi:hypothetical protein
MPDPGDPFDAMVESFIAQVRHMAAEAKRITIFRDLPKEQQVQCLMKGVLHGMVAAGVDLTWEEMPRGRIPRVLLQALAEVTAGGEPR